MPVTLAVAESDWRDWFISQIDSSLAVVVDATILRSSTRWELEMALKILGTDRVAVLVPKDQRHETFGGQVIEYDPQRIPESKAQLADWIDGVVLELFGV